MRTVVRATGPQNVDDGDGEGNLEMESIQKKTGGIAYRPEFVLDSVLLCDNLREPSLLKDSVTRSGWANQFLFVTIVVGFVHWLQ